jgi:osmotically-inducible protein OsmY
VRKKEVTVRKIKRAGIRQADFELATAASNAIKLLTTVPAEAVSITARDGHLDLDGRVDTVRQRAVIEDVTRALPGVRGVTNSIYVAADPVFA